MPKTDTPYNSLLPSPRYSGSETGVDEELFDAFAIVAGILSTPTIEKILTELAGRPGRIIIAARQALSYIKAMRPDLDSELDSF